MQLLYCFMMASNRLVFYQLVKPLELELEVVITITSFSLCMCLKPFIQCRLQVFELYMTKTN